METRFGKWIKTKGFARLFVLVLLGAACYMGLRAGNAADWLWGRRLYGPIFLLVLLLMLLAVYAQHTGVQGRFQRCCKRISAYFLCFLLYDVLALLVSDLAGLLLRLGPAVRGWLVVAAAAISALLLLWGSAHARRLVCRGAGDGARYPPGAAERPAHRHLYRRGLSGAGGSGGQPPGAGAGGDLRGPL